ncbi:hypothetical protein Zmor_012222 [Zophobas morio]|uniref:NADP-dependent oxidoreductase domain-containing protein n=1 Tax=Zophobas morio TaxID=2755281 RepID=A0AA38LYF5_9CUCU|nr:hypothetical protein Zmor_012222 [Zophobas morio]
MMNKILNETYKLHNGVEMPKVGFGTFRMTDPKITKAAVIHALQHGYKMIDTVDVYGNHEIIREAIKESGVNRKDIFITTKV